MSSSVAESTLSGLGADRSCRCGGDSEYTDATLGSTWGHIGVQWVYRRRMAGAMHIGAGLVELKNESVHATKATRKLWSQEGPREREPDHFGSFWLNLFCISG